MSTIFERTPSVHRVLLATDFTEPSEAAVKASLDLCLVLSASLYILNFFEYISIVAPESGGQLLQLGDFYQDAESSLKMLLEKARRNGIPTVGTVGTGVASSCIIDYERSEAIDLVVLGTRAIRGFERLVFGSTAEAVIRKSTCPVLTVGPMANPRTIQMKAAGGVVVFATDFDTTTTDALEHAASFAATMGLPLHCLNVLPRGAVEGTHKGVTSLVIEKALRHVAVKLAVMGTPPVCAITHGSEVSNAVVEYAREHGARLVVLGVRRASLAASHIPAHIAYRIITEAPCPVLTIAYPPNIRAIRPSLLEQHDSQPASPTIIQ